MKTVAIAVGIVLSLTANTANATIELFDCRKTAEVATIIEVDRDSQAFTITEGGTAQIDHQPICAAFGSMAGDVAKGTKARCAVAFGQDVIAADYAALDGPVTFNVMIALDTKRLTLTSIARVATSAAMVETVPCKRL